MRKFFKYFLILLAALGLVFILFSCKAKKAVVGPEAASPNIPAAPSADMNNLMFGQMYIDACAQRMKGNLQEALKLFEECQKLDKTNPAVYYELGTVYKLLGNNEKAIANARISATAEPLNEWYQLLLIDCYNTTRQYSQAIKVREALVKAYPSRNDFKEELAIDYAVSGFFDKSFRIYDELEKAFGVNEQITMNKLKLLKSQKKVNDAEKELLKLSASNPSESRYYGYLAEFYLENNQHEKAKAMYDKILSTDPTNAVVHLALHDYYTGKGKEIEAFDHLKSAFLDPDLDIVTKTNIIGSFYTKAEQHSLQAREQGRDLAAIMIKMYPKAPESNAMYADFLMLEKKVKEASPYYYYAAINEKRDYRVWDNLLFVDNELGQFDSLEKHSADAIELFPNQPRNYLYNGVANTQLRNYQKAARSLTEGMEFVVDNKSLKLDFLRLSGDAKYNIKDYEGSDKAFDEALKIDPDNLYVLNNYAYYLSQRNESLEKAEKLSKRTIELAPNNRNYLDTYGWILYRQKKFREAEELLSRAASMGPPNSTILEHYGDVLYRVNKPDEAVLHWTAAQAAGGNSEALTKKIKNKKLDD